MYVLVLGLKVLVPLLSFAFVARSEWSKQRDKSVLELARQTAGRAVIAVAVAAGLVVDHMNQSAAAAAAQEDAAGTREARQRIEESMSQQAVALTAAREDAAEARQALERLEGATAEVVALMREQDPGLTEQEALDRIGEELRELRERSVDLEDQLTGLRMYSDVAELDIFGVSGLAGNGLSWTSPLSQAIEELPDNDVCGKIALTKLLAITERHPSFPFAHYMLSECAFLAGDASWLQHADRALEILRHTTQIPGHHPHHSEAYRLLRSRMEQQQ